MFTAVVRISGAGRLEDFRERLRWLMVRDADAEEYTEHHVPGALEYRFQPVVPLVGFLTGTGMGGSLPIRVENRSPVLVGYEGS